MPFDPDKYLANKAKLKADLGFDPDKYLAEKQMQDAPGDVGGAVMEGFGTGASLGYLPELQAIAGQLVPDPNADLDAAMRKAGFQIQQGDDGYIQQRDENVARQKKLAASNPYAYYGSMVGGAIATAPAIEARAAGLLPAGAGVVAKGAATGAAMGALANPGSTEGKTVLTDLDAVKDDVLGRLKGAAVGAGLGAGLAAGGKYLSNKFGKSAAPAASGNAPTPPGPGGGLPKIKEKVNAAEIQRAAKALGIDLTESQLLDDAFMQKMDSLLAQSPTLVGRSHAQPVKEGFEAVQKAAEKSLAGATEATESQVGSRIQTSLTSKIRAEKQPISQLYEMVRDSTQHIEVSDKSKLAIARNILKLDQAKFSGPAQNLVKSRADDILAIQNVDDIKRLITSVRGSLSATASAEERSAVAEITRRLKGLEENTITRAAEKMAKETGSKATAGDILRLLDERKVADQSYKAFISKLEDLSGVVKGGKVRSPEAFVQKIQEIPEEEFARRLFSKNNARGLKFVQEHFPDEAKEIFSLEKAKLLQKHLRDGKVNAPAFLREVDKYSPEVREALFGKVGMARLKAAKTYLQSLPPKANPSETATATEILSFWKNPIDASAMTARDLLIKGFLKAGKALDSGAMESAMEAAGKVKEVGRKALSTLDDAGPGAKAPLIQGGGPKRTAYTGPERRTAEEPKAGPDKWANEGIKRLREHGANVDEKLLKNPRARSLILHASDLKPGGRGMARIAEEIAKLRTVAMGDE
jgi:hypothetical protein